MSSLTYLLATRIKNQFKEFIKTPSKLIVAILIIFVVGSSVFASGGNTGTAQRDVSELYAMCFALYTLIFVMISYKGFSSGATMFSMADVNLVFTGPASPRRVLSYGLVQQLGQSFLLGLVIIYQYGWMSTTYAISVPEVLLLLAGYAITVFISRLTAMIIYMFTASNDKKMIIAKALYFAVIIAFAIYAVYIIYPLRSNALNAAVTAVNSFAIRFFPVSGWMQTTVCAVISGKYLTAGIAFAGSLAFCGICYALISFIQSDYYEDVLQATETSFSAITAKKEGKVTEALPKKVRLGKLGINAGMGANTFYYKHKIENRRSRVFMMSVSSLVMAGVTIAASAFFKDYLAYLFAFNIYMLMFFIGMGRWARELILPYVYLIPESPFKKLFFCILESIPTLLIESIITFVPIAFIIKLTPLQTIGIVLLRTSFGLLFLGVNLLLQRFMGTTDKKVLVVMVYLFAVIAFATPSLAAGTSVLYFVGDYMSFAVTGVASVVNLLIFILLLFISRNLLSYSELNNK